MTVRVSPEEEALLKRIAEEVGISISDVFRRALAILAAEGQEELEREQVERQEGAALLERIRAAGHLQDDEALAGQPVALEVVTSRRVVARWAGHVFQEIAGRLVVARRQLDGAVEIAYLDGPEPEEPDVSKFFAERVLV
jgi:hypothetical protein